MNFLLKMSAGRPSGTSIKTTDLLSSLFWIFIYIDYSCRFMMYNLLIYIDFDWIWRLWISDLYKLKHKHKYLQLPLWKKNMTLEHSKRAAMWIRKKEKKMTSFRPAITIEVMHKLLFQVELCLVCQCQMKGFARQRPIKSSD